MGLVWEITTKRKMCLILSSKLNSNFAHVLVNIKSTDNFQIVALLALLYIHVIHYYLKVALVLICIELRMSHAAAIRVQVEVRGCRMLIPINEQ